MTGACSSLCSLILAGLMLGMSPVLRIAEERGESSHGDVLCCVLSGSSVLSLDLAGLSVEGESGGEHSPWLPEGGDPAVCCWGACLS